MFFIKNNKIIALEVSHTSIRMMAISKSKDVYVIDSYASLPIDASISSQLKISKNNALEDDDHLIVELSKVINNAYKLLKTDIKVCAIYLPEIDTFQKEMEFDGYMTSEDIESRLVMDSNKLMPFSEGEKAAIDFSFIQKSENEQDKHKVLVSACKQSTLDYYLQVTKLAGLELKIVDMEKLCIERSFSEFISSLLPSNNEMDVVAVVDIGVSGLRLNVLKGGIMIYSREYGINRESVLARAKEEYGLIESDAINALVSMGSDSEEFYESIALPHYVKIMDSVDNGLMNFYSSTEYSDVHYIVLSGSGANYVNLDEEFRKRFTAFIYIADPVKVARLGKKVDRVQLSDASQTLVGLMGLAVREIKRDY